MTRTNSGLVSVIVVGLIVASWAMHTAASGGNEDKSKPGQTDEAKPAPKKAAMKLFMRKKLEASQSVLEGLAIEDFDMIAVGARQLKTTSAAAEFMVVNDPMYAQHADEFRRIVDKLEKAGKERRLDGATLAYVDMTLSCVECHKYVRNVLIAGQ
jgi:hypothetical protein